MNRDGMAVMMSGVFIAIIGVYSASHCRQTNSAKNKTVGNLHYWSIINTDFNKTGGTKPSLQKSLPRRQSCCKSSIL